MKPKFRKVMLKEFFRFNRPNFYVAGFGILLAALFIAAMSDEYSCSNKLIYGTVVSFRTSGLGGYANFRSLGVRHEAEVRLQDGKTIYIEQANLNVGEQVALRKCKSDILHFSKYEKIRVSHS